MGYNTTFDIKAKRLNDGPSFEEIRAKATEWARIEDQSPFTQAYAEKMSGYLKACYLVPPKDWEEFDYAVGGEELKFYEWREVLKRISAAFPDFVFYVEWHGEDAGDHGKAEFHKGKTREAKAVVPPLPEKWS